MKRIKLSKGKYALVDDSDFEWLIKWKWHYNSVGYAMRTQYLVGINKMVNGELDFV